MRRTLMRRRPRQNGACGGRGGGLEWGVVVVSLMLLACAGEVDSGGDPVLTLVSPLDQDVVCGAPLAIEVAVENFTLGNDASDDPPDDLGHVHPYLNGEEVGQEYKASFVVAHMPDGSDIAEGVWQLRVELARADHKAVEPYTSDKAYITVDNSKCGED